MVTGAGKRRRAVMAVASLIAAVVAGTWGGPAGAQGAAVPGAPTQVVAQRGVCGSPVTLTWFAPADPTELVYHYQISARNTTPGSVQADWVSSDVSGWAPWTKQWNDTVESLGAGTWGTFEVGVTAVGANGAGPTEWATVPPCRPAPVANVTVQFVSANRVMVAWTPGFDAATTVSKYDVYFNLAGWSSWVEDRGTTSVEVNVPTGGVLPQVRIAPRGWYGPGPAIWFCDPPSRTCING